LLTSGWVFDCLLSRDTDFRTLSTAKLPPVTSSSELPEDGSVARRKHFLLLSPPRSSTCPTPLASIRPGDVRGALCSVCGRSLRPFPGLFVSFCSIEAHSPFLPHSSFSGPVVVSTASPRLCPPSRIVQASSESSGPSI
jgi:hypothetical protein